MSILLTSTVIVALISFYKWKQSQALERITDSRAEWREGLRKIAIDILEADDYDERILLSELKVRINTKGLMLRLNNLNSEQDKNDYFMQDGYIWELIKKIEISNGKSQKDMLKQKLVEAISLLIKYDWDRSKHEITSNQVTKFNRMTYLLLVLTVILVIGYIFSVKDIKFDLAFALLMIIGLPIIIPFIYLWLDNEYHNYRDYDNLNNHNKKKLYNVEINRMSSLLSGLAIMVVIELVYFIFSNAFEENTWHATLALIIMSAMVYLSHYVSVQAYSELSIYSYFKVAESIIKSIPEIHRCNGDNT
ncbi:hypothetical protein A4V01_12105 [Erysipelotrichaceae bacterium I46]|uniref:hypothetical protein n=1 Tax=Clostridium innocuum TaxID=1522 RepID=UPI00080C5C26|nr:hypothetical protein [[Clostridium] innocuum]ANU69621.1 hypothetical protein A4V01_12105 [Erysipelotrichaceae bacterium I46]ASU17942.1 hypothetical protein ADH65_05160 [[Clostridium] innocuum]QQR26490.1 hypothetical protein I5Q87_00560 [[Clostridium] innocuum]